MYHYWLLSLTLCCTVSVSVSVAPIEVDSLRGEVSLMFSHGFGSYLQHGFPLDELKPLSCEGRDRQKENRGHVDDCMGNFSMTLIDSLDTLAVMGRWDEFESGMKMILDTVNFSSDYTVSVFEVTIRVLGGLLSIHMLAERNPDKLSMYYQGEMLGMAQDLADRLMPAFKTGTGIPYSRINLKRGVMMGETTETCTAGAGTLILEFGMLSKLTGNPKYEEAASGALKQLWKLRSHLDLMGNVVNIHTGRWVQAHSGIGAGIDSFYEYLLKAYILFGDEDYLMMFQKSCTAIDRHMKRNGWYLEVNMKSGNPVKDWVDALQAFWPALQVLSGDITDAIEGHSRLATIWKKIGFLPEGFSPYTVRAIPHMRGYPLRPEFIESTLHLYLATGDTYYLEIGKEMMHSIQNHTRVPCGFASINNVEAKTLEDRMDSFFLSETLKYLYLLFDKGNEYNSMDYIFSTEGHIFPLNFPLRQPSSTITSSVIPPTQKICEVPSPLPMGIIAQFHSESISEEATEEMCEMRHSNTAQRIESTASTTLKFELSKAAPPIPSILRVEGPSWVSGDYVGRPAAFGPSLDVHGITGQFSFGSTACFPLDAESIKGTILFAFRGNCNFIEKVQNAEKAGAIAVVIGNIEEGLFTMTAQYTEEEAVHIPAMLLPYSISVKLITQMSYERMTVTLFASEPYNMADVQIVQATDSTSPVLDNRGFIVFQPPLYKDHMMTDAELLEWLQAEVLKLGLQEPVIFFTEGGQEEPPMIVDGQGQPGTNRKANTVKT